MLTKVCWRGEGVGERHTCYILKILTHFDFSVWSILNESCVHLVATSSRKDLSTENSIN